MKTNAIAILLTIIVIGCSSEVNMASDECQSLSPCEDTLDASTRITDGQLNDTDQSVNDAGVLVDMSETADVGVIESDMDLPADMWVPPCPPISGDSSLATDWAPEGVVTVGRPADGLQVMSINLDADLQNTPEFLVVSEGALALYDTSGKLKWKTGVLGIQRLQAVLDLDQNGSIEIVASGPRTVVLIAALTGETLWTLPADAFGDAPLAAVGKMFVTDFDNDGLNELYVVNGGCGDSGNGAGLIYDYQNETMTQRLQIFGNRANGRCGTWQTIYDTDGDGTQELLIPDGNGLNAFSTTSGDKIVCGGHTAPANGPNPTISFDSGTGPAWLTFAGATIHRLEIRPSATCPAGRSFESVWQTDTTAPFSLEGAGFYRNASGEAESFYFGMQNAAGNTSVWSLNLADGTLTEKAPGQTLLGMVSAQDDQSTYMLTRQAVDSDRHQLIFSSSVNGRWTSLATIDRQLPSVVTEAFSERTSTQFRRPISFSAGVDQVPSVAITSLKENGVDHQLELFTVSGMLIARIDAPFSGTFFGQCRTRAPCSIADATALQGIGSNGLLMTIPFDPDQSPISHFEVMTGNGLLIPLDGTPGRLGVLTENGTLNVFQEVGRGFEQVWQQVVGPPKRKQTFGMGATIGARSVFVIRDPRYGQAAWTAFDAENGERLWTHTLNDEEATVFNPPVLLGGEDAVFLRMDYSQDNLIPQDPTCPETILPEDSDFFTPHPNCPTKAVRSRVITAIEPLTGACRWRRVFKAQYPLNTNGTFYGCPGPTNQRLSILPAQGASPALGMVTESMTLRQFSLEEGPADGELADFSFVHTFGKTSEGHNIGGGSVSRLHDGTGVLLSGGATPPMVFNNDLSIQWSASDPGLLRPQSWIGRETVHLGDWIWTSASGGHPLIKLNANTGEVAQLYGLRDGELTAVDAFLPEWREIKEIRRFSLTDDTFLTVVTDDGVIYFINADGALDFAYHAATPVRGLSGLNIESRRRLLHVTGGGRLVSISPSLALAPTHMLEVQCPVMATCDEARDIDETTVLDKLCLAWTPVADAIGYEIALESSSGALLTPWKQVNQESLTTLDGLELLPGQTYYTVVRAIFETEGTLELSTIVRSDGITAVNSTAPTVVLSAVPVTPERVRIEVSAEDDDRLATWKLDALNLDNGQLIERIGSGPLGAASWSETFELRLNRYAEIEPPITTIQIVATVTDRSGNEARETLPIELP